MNSSKCAALEKSDGNIDYLKGRSMKVFISGDVIDTYLFNRDNGHNAAEKAIAQLRRNNQ